MRVLLCGFANPGMLFPLIGLGIELRARGNETLFVTAQEATPWLSSVGMSRAPRGHADGPSYRVHVWAQPLCVALDVKHLEYAIQQFQPDVLVTHALCLAPLICRERLGVPVAVIGLMSNLWPLAPGHSSSLPSEITAIRDWRLKDMLSHYNRCRAVFGMDPARVSNPFHADLFMLRSVPELEPETDSLPPHVQLIGAALWEAPVHEHCPEDRTAWDEISNVMSRNRPIVYVQIGRTFGESGFWETLVKGLGETPVSVVASASRADGQLGPIPSNFVVTPHAPQTLVIPHCCAVISGGYSTPTLGAMTFGRPTIAFPTGGETPDNAYRVERYGCGVAVRRGTLSPDAARGLVESVCADREVKERCILLQRTFGARPSFEVAATLVESIDGVRGLADTSTDFRRCGSKTRLDSIGLHRSDTLPTPT